MRKNFPIPKHLLLAPGPAPEVSAETREFHWRTPVVDLHSDPMLKNLDLNLRHKRGHIDFPRLIQGGVNLSLFSVPTGGPPNASVFRMFCRLNRWPGQALKTFSSMADFQINMARNAIDASQGRAFLVQSPDDLPKKPAQNIAGVLLTMEGGQPLMGRIENLDRFYEKGVRSLCLTHFVKNDLAGSSYHQDEKNRGVSPFGQDVLSRMQELGMIVDLAHASRATFSDVLKHTKGPVMVSHTGVSGVHPLWRNLEDDQIQAVGERKGVIGIIYEAMFLGARTLDRVIGHMEHVIKLVGEDSVSLGSDWDGCMFVPHGLRDSTHLPCLTQKMFDRGWSRRTVAKVLGKNFIRMYRGIRPA